MYIRNKECLYDYISKNKNELAQTIIDYLDMSFNDMDFIENNFLNLDANVLNIDFSNNNLNEYDENLNVFLLKSKTTLRKLMLHSNNFNSINIINNLTNIQTLYLSNNILPYLNICLPKLECLVVSKIHNSDVLNQIANCVNIKSLFCASNNITSIPSTITNLKELKVFICGYNKISTLPSYLFSLTNLQQLSLSSNCINAIEKNISTLANLSDFILSNNALTTLPAEITQLRNLQHFKYIGCPIEYIPPQLKRFLDRLEYRGNHQGIYQDNQNVHNSNIQKCIKTCIEYILQIPPTVSFEQVNQFIVETLYFSEKSKGLLFEYIQDPQVHSVLEITFAELFRNVISLILKHEKCNEILHILDTEIQDAECMCFTGRISRLVNTLNGFDENIVIHISDAEEIGNVIAQLKQKYYYDISLEEFKKIVENELISRKYSKNIIETWIQYIE